MKIQVSKKLNKLLSQIDPIEAWKHFDVPTEIDCDEYESDQHINMEDGFSLAVRAIKANKPVYKVCGNQGGWYDKFYFIGDEDEVVIKINKFASEVKKLSPNKSELDEKIAKVQKELKSLLKKKNEK
jgi:hypothetical protein